MEDRLSKREREREREREKEMEKIYRERGIQTDRDG